MSTRSIPGKKSWKYASCNLKQLAAPGVYNPPYNDLLPKAFEKPIEDHLRDACRAPSPQLSQVIWSSVECWTVRSSCRRPCEGQDFEVCKLLGHASNDSVRPRHQNMPSPSGSTRYGASQASLQVSDSSPKGDAEVTG